MFVDIFTLQIVSFGIAGQVKKNWRIIVLNCIPLHYTIEKLLLYVNHLFAPLPRGENRIVYMVTMVPEMAK